MLHDKAAGRCAGAMDTAAAAHLIERKLPLEVNEQPAVAEEVVEAGLIFHEGMHGRVQQLHKLPQRQQLTMHCPATEGHRACEPHMDRTCPLYVDVFSGTIGVFHAKSLMQQYHTGHRK